MPYYLRTLQASNIEKSTIDVKKEQRGVMATQTAATAAGAKTFTAEEKNACSIDAMLNNGTVAAGCPSHDPFQLKSSLLGPPN